jgi:hypothetical protein
MSADERKSRSAASTRNDRSDLVMKGSPVRIRASAFVFAGVFLGPRFFGPAGGHKTDRRLVLRLAVGGREAQVALLADAVL